jgi:hypothetical protein
MAQFPRSISFRGVTTIRVTDKLPAVLPIRFTVCARAHPNYHISICRLTYSRLLTYRLKDAFQLNLPMTIATQRYIAHTLDELSL